MIKLRSLLKANRKFITLQEFLQTGEGKFRQSPFYNQVNLENVLNEIVEKNIQLLVSKTFTRNHILYMKKENPFVFTEHKPMVKVSLQDWFSYTSKELGLTTEEQKEIVLIVPTLIQLPLSEYGNRFNELESLLGMSREEVKQVLVRYPKVFFASNKSLQINYNTLFTIFNFQEDKVKELLKRHTFLLTLDNQQMRSFLYKLLEFGFTADDIYNITLQYPLYLFKTYGNLKMVFTMMHNMGLSNRQIVQICSTNPFSFSLEYKRVFVPKLKILKDNGLSNELQGQLFYKYPWLMTKSVDSFKVKFRYLVLSHEIDFFKDSFAASLLNYDYSSFIKPRGEIMLKKQYNDWKKVMKMTDSEFCKEMGCTVQELDDLKIDRKGKRELDYVKMKNLSEISRSVWDSYFDHPMLN